MSKNQLQGCLIAIISLCGNIPGIIVYVYLLNTVGMPIWVWMLYITGLVWSTLMTLVSLVVTITTTENSYKEMLENFEERIKKLVE